MTIEKSNSTEKFAEQLDARAQLYMAAFANFPWFEVLAEAEAKARLETSRNKAGFAFVDKVEAEALLGSAWYDAPTLGELESERGPELAEFAKTILEDRGIAHLIWERDVMVDPNHWKKGIATEIRNAMLEEIQESFGEALILTRMRDDNTGIIKVAERLGFQRTGIRRPSSQTPNFMHEFWYKILEKKIE